MSVRRLPRTLLAVVAALLAAAAQAATDRELAQQCNDLVAKLYRESWPKAGPDDGGLRAKFESHYNAKLGRCLYLETVSGLVRSPALKRILPRETQRLVDAEENRSLGQYDSWNDAVPVTCWLQDKRCASKREWQGLLKPYLEE